MKTIEKLKPYQIIEEKLRALKGGNSNNEGNDPGGNGSSGSNNSVGSNEWDDNSK